MHIGDRSDVEAAAWLTGDDHARLFSKGAAENKLLHVAPGEKAHRGGRGGTLHFEVSYDESREVARGSPVEKSMARESFIAIALGDHVLGHRHIANEALGVTVFRYPGNAQPHRRARGQARKIGAGDS